MYSVDFKLDDIELGHMLRRVEIYLDKPGYIEILGTLPRGPAVGLYDDLVAIDDRLVDLVDGDVVTPVYIKSYMLIDNGDSADVRIILEICKSQPEIMNVISEALEIGKVYWFTLSDGRMVKAEVAAKTRDIVVLRSYMGNVSQHKIDTLKSVQQTTFN